MKPFINSGREMPWAKVFATALLVGTLDICLAFLSAYMQRGTMPEKVLLYAASGVFGKPAFTGGAGTAACGLLFHYIIATCFTITIFLFYRYGLFPIKNRIITGILAGVIIWAVMQYIVVPLSQVPPRTKPPELKDIVKAAGILIIAIGLPASLIAGKHFSLRRLKV